MINSDNDILIGIFTFIAGVCLIIFSAMGVSDNKSTNEQKLDTVKCIEINKETYCKK